MDLAAHIQQGESNTLEFKQSFGKEAIETVVANRFVDEVEGVKNKMYTRDLFGKD